MSGHCETVVLILKDVVFRHTEFSGLGTLLIKKHDFKKIEDKKSELSKTEKTIAITPRESEDIPAQNILEETIKLSVTRIFLGNYLDAEIKVYMLGEITQNADTVEVDPEESYTVYTTKYQLIKIVSESGYVIGKFVEHLSIDVGLKIGSKKWFFHRSRHA
ncbi:MAG: hypothetical protein IAX21_10295 [Candidatus Bathyarchaeota archaeon]|nr:hypothetical protein [Candidatus Bathyarchaeum tardum]WGM88735.1 MAG: hypothetical protein NUK63_07380 [Candidatus Bathyarchaeum tardum]WNZ29011.1 MAG: hypothetical protein IAX21_10295 [Candidatus Bathyarchaeota archaeon]